MFSIVRLLEDARSVEAVDTAELRAFIATTLLNLRGRVVKVTGHTSQRYPQAPKLLDPIRDVLETSAPIAHDEIRIPALRDLLFRPARVYPEKETTTEGAGLGVTLLGAFHDPDVEDPLVVEVRLIFGLQLEAEASYATADSAASMLERVYLRTELSARTVLPGPKKAPQLAWLGGSASEGATPPDWRDRIEAAAAVHGFNAQIHEQPYRRFDYVRRELHDAGATAAVVWVPYAGNPTGWSTMPAAHGGDLQMLPTTEETFEDALLDATMQLEEWLAEDGHTDEIPADLPKSGEVRIYKKEYATPGHDVMVRSNDCGHNAWKPARKAPKAEKGVTKLERHTEIAFLEKCMRCTGGGRWRVTFS